MALPQYADHLLPRNSTALERVLSAAGARLTGIPIDIDKLKRPYDLPVQFLPHLGFELSVDVWEKTWLETRRRAAVASAIPLQIRKGTAHTLREYIRYADGIVKRIDRPPQGVLLGKSLTKEEREAWLSGLPQIRIWSAREEATAPLRKFFACASNTAAMHSGKFLLSWAFPIPSTALKRHQRRARWVVNGVETDTRVSNDGSTERLHIPSTAGKAMFCDRPFAGKYLIRSTAWQRLITVEPTRALPWRSAVVPSLQAITAEPELIKVSGTRRQEVFCGLPLKGFLVKTTAPMRIYHRYAVYDGSIPPRRAVTFFMGNARLGWPPHYARARVSVPSTRPRYAFTANTLLGGSIRFDYRMPSVGGIYTATVQGRDRQIKVPPPVGIHVKEPRPGSSTPRQFFVPHNPEPLAKVIRAARASKRLSDRIELDIGPDHRFVAGKPFIADVDSFIAGYP